MNQLSVAEKIFPKSEPDMAQDFFALRKIFSGKTWKFTEGRNLLNPASHCDIAWAGALATKADTQTFSAGPIFVFEDIPAAKSSPAARTGASKGETNPAISLVGVQASACSASPHQNLPLVPSCRPRALTRRSCSNPPIHESTNPSIHEAITPKRMLGFQFPLLPSRGSAFLLSALPPRNPARSE